jgi:hypothetical protein
MQKPKQERRRYIRIKKSFLLTYFDKSEPSRKHEITQLKNISLGGMCFITSQSFNPATELVIELKTPYLAETTHLEGVVLESHVKMKNRIYETRLGFRDLDTEAKILLEKLMEYFLNGKSS